MLHICMRDPTISKKFKVITTPLITEVFCNRENFLCMESNFCIYSCINERLREDQQFEQEPNSWKQFVEVLLRLGSQNHFSILVLN
jgi:hypothetical protein